MVANAALSGLTDEQINAITTLSQNDENSVIAKKTGEIYGNLDVDILTASGVEKTELKKHAITQKRVLGDFKTKAESVTGLESQIAILTKEKTRLEKVIADGGADAETAKQFKAGKKQIWQTLQLNIQS